MLIDGNLVGERVILRNINENDGNITYFEWLNDPDVNRFLETRWKNQTMKGIKEYIKSMICSSQDILLAIELKDSREHVGNIKLGGIDYNNRNANIGYLIGDKDCWGLGIATEAVALIADYALNILDLHSVIAGIIEGHNSSKRVLEKNGFELCAVLKEACYFEGRYVSHLYYEKVNV